MNPRQMPGAPTPGGQPVSPDVTSRPVADIPETGFGFADEPPKTPAVRPATGIPNAAPAPAPKPLIPPTPPSPAAPQAIVQAPAAKPPVVADVMPPQRIPAVPTLAPVAPAPITAAPKPAPTPIAQPEPIPIAPTQPSPLGAPSVSAASETTASYAPTPITHLPDDIASRISEHPMQNSSDILRQVKRGAEGSRLKSVFSIIVFCAGIFVAAFLINQFIFQSYYVEGTSMTPTLQNNDRLIISKVEHTLATVQGKPYIPDRGQIVVLDSSIVGLNGQKEQLIKRVVGLPGEHIHIEAGTVIITNGQNPNGFDVTKQLGLTNLQATYSDSVIDLTIPQGQVYVMGDNREQGGSYDSRSFGPIDGDKIQGRLWARVLPLDHAQLF